MARLSSRIEDEQRAGIGRGDARLDRHAYLDRLGRDALDAAHEPRPFGEIDEGDVAVAAILRPIAHHRRRIYRALAARRAEGKARRGAVGAMEAWRKDLLRAALAD